MVLRPARGYPTCWWWAGGDAENLGVGCYRQAITARLSPEQAQITIIDPKTSLIGRIPDRNLRAYAYTPDDIDDVLATSPR